MNNNTFHSKSFLSKLYGGEYKFSHVFWYGTVLSLLVNLILTLITNGNSLGMGLIYIFWMAWFIAMWQSRNNIKRKAISYTLCIIAILGAVFGLISLIFLQNI